MELRHLELVDWRSYRHVELALPPGVTVLVGANAQGKTNLVEAVHYLSVGESHRVAADAALVRAGADAAVVRATVVAAGRERTVELELRPKGRNRARVDGAAPPRGRDAFDVVRSVLVAPEDLDLVRGDPGGRRRFLDVVLAQRRRAYGASRQEYERVLRQRNALLRSSRPGAGDATLDTWTEALVAAGAVLLAARIALVHALAEPVEEAFRDLVSASPQREASGALELRYELSTGRVVAAQPGAGVPDPALLAEELRDGLADVAGAERDRGMTLRGPHRDELGIVLNGLPARGYASSGETWSLVLALRLGSRDVLAAVGDEPVVLLDDVFAELDEARRERLASRCKLFSQVLVTGAVASDIPLEGTRYRIVEGQVSAA